MAVGPAVAIFIFRYDIKRTTATFSPRRLFLEPEGATARNAATRLLIIYYFEYIRICQSLVYIPTAFTGKRSSTFIDFLHLTAGAKIASSEMKTVNITYNT